MVKRKNGRAATQPKASSATERQIAAENFRLTGNRTLAESWGREWFEKTGHCQIAVRDLFLHVARTLCMTLWHAKHDLVAPELDRRHDARLRSELSRMRLEFVESLRPASNTSGGPPHLGEAFRRCAVVGSSGSLLHDTLGREIDAHDVILRFNNAPSGAGYEAFVGSRTDMRILNSHAAAAVLQRCAVISDRGVCKPSPNASRCCPSGHLVLNSGRATIVDCFRRTCGNPTAPNVLKFMEQNALVQAFTQRLKPLSVMSGIYGLVSGLLLCSHSVSLYGFTISNRTASAFAPLVAAAKRPRYHYYDDCHHFDTDALNKTATLLSLDWFGGVYAGRQIRMVYAGRPSSASPEPERASLPPPQPCPDRKAVAYISGLLQRRREVWSKRGGALPECCPKGQDLEPRGRQMCVAVAERAKCEGSLGRICPVACEGCRLCPGHEQLAAYQKMWRGLRVDQLRNPPLPDYYGIRKAKIVHAIGDVTVFGRGG